LTSSDDEYTPFTVLTEMKFALTVTMLCKSGPQKCVAVLFVDKQIELGECLLTFGPESPPFSVQKYKDENIQNYNVACFCMGVKIGLSQ
jgi:hypothetical protein